VKNVELIRLGLPPKKVSFIPHEFFFKKEIGVYILQRPVGASCSALLVAAVAVNGSIIDLIYNTPLKLFHLNLNVIGLFI
jgi:hypothetical protein